MRHAQLIVFLSFMVLLHPVSAMAGPDDPAEIPYGQDFVPLDECMGSTPIPMVPIDGNTPPTGRQVVFLNFDGADLVSGGNDARSNTTMLLTTSSHAYPAMVWGGSYGGKDKGMANVVLELKKLYYKYGVTFVTTRPTSGDYTMAMIGGDGTNCKQGGAGTVGIAPLDCKNSSKNDVVLIFGSKLTNVRDLTFVIAHELAHSFGLEHTDDPTDIMYPALSSTTTTWKSGNVSASTCGRSTQDGDKVLTENLGIGDPDQVAPLIWILRPGNKAIVPSRFTFEVAAKDDFSLSSVTVYVDGQKQFTLTQGPFLGYVTGLSDGKHTLKAEAQDMKPNVATAEITVEVDSACAASGECWKGKAGPGSTCAVGSDCQSGICAVKDGVGLCAVGCLNDKDPLCPTGLTCQQASGEYACTAGTGYELNKEKAGGCQVSGSLSDGAGLGPVLFGLAALLIRRRRAPRSSRV